VETHRGRHVKVEDVLSGGKEFLNLYAGLSLQIKHALALVTQVLQLISQLLQTSGVELN